MSERILVSKEQLVSILKQELSKTPECADVSVSYPPYHLVVPDENGCNWDNDIVFRGPDGNSARWTAASIVSRVAARYNLRSAQEPKVNAVSISGNREGAAATVPRETGLLFAIDANRINARQKLPNMNRLERWKADGIISIMMPETAHSEATQGGDPKRRLKTSRVVITVNTMGGDEERELRRKVTQLLSPGKAPGRNTAKDIDIIANAYKYGCILITAGGDSRGQPGGILGNKEALSALGVQVVTDSETVALVEDRLRHRDQAEINLARVQNRIPASWVGRDT